MTTTDTMQRSPVRATDPPVRLGVVVGSTRPGRKASAVAAWVAGIAENRDDLAVKVLDLAEVGLPLLDEELPPAMGRYQRPHTLRWAEQVALQDAFVLVTPEYNHGTSAALKNALDFLHAEWLDKAVGFVGYGADGAIRAVEQLRLVVGELQMAPVRNQVALTLSDDFEEMSRFAPRDRQEGRVRDMLNQIVRWAPALRTVRSDGRDHS